MHRLQLQALRHDEESAPVPGYKTPGKLRYTWSMDIEHMVGELFDIFDENKDGVISRREFIALAESLLHQKGMSFSSDIFNHFDTNHDNVISREELIDMIIELAL
jgi:guanylate cyclase activator 1